MQYRDFSIKIGPQRSGRYPVYVMRSPAGEDNSAFELPFGEEELRDVIEKLKLVVRHSSGPAERSARDLSFCALPEAANLTPQDVGARLFQALFRDQVLSLFDRSLGVAEGTPDTSLRLKLHFDPDHPDLARLSRLPWELLYRHQERSFLGLSRASPLVRYLDIPRGITLKPFTLPLRILVVISSPEGEQSLDLEEEQKYIGDAWGELSHVEVVRLRRPTPDALRACVLGDNFHVLHFMGHGTFDSSSGEGALILEDDAGRPMPVPGRTLANILRHEQHSLRLVFLNACDTARCCDQGLDAFAGVATALMISGIPAVVAMQFPISDRAAITFCKSFYGRLVAGDPVDAATVEGRMAIHLKDSQSFEWSTPVLFMRVPDGSLFSPRSVESASDASSRLVKSNSPEFTSRSAAVSPPRTQHRGYRRPSISGDRRRPAAEHLLHLGQEIQSRFGGPPWRVSKLLGFEGQCEIYCVEQESRKMALKWYPPRYRERDPALIERLEKAIEIGSPSERFLWPVELIAPANTQLFGYLMPLRETRFKGMADLMKRRIQPTFRSLSRAGFELACGYAALHSRGLYYRNVDFENFCFDPAVGEIRICINENVDFRHRSGGFAGSPRFMAPEVVQRKADPSIEGDLFSLAVLLFHLLFIHHPLEGDSELNIDALDLPAMRQLYGSEAIFVYDPDDDRNRPIPGKHDNAIVFWKIYPNFLKERFTEAFTKGLSRPDCRVSAEVWRRDMMRLRDSVFLCRRCSAQNFYDIEKLWSPVGGSCWRCHSDLRLPARIQFDRKVPGDLEADVVVLDHDSRLYLHHVDHSKPHDSLEVIAEMTEHPMHSGLWGLRNQSSEAWFCEYVDGRRLETGPREILMLEPGIQVDFGKVKGRIKL